MIYSADVPGWLVEEIAAGSRAAGRSRCRDCGAPIWRGLDADAAALLVHLDPSPIDSMAEASIWAIGGWTYELWYAGSRHEIVHRRSGRWRWCTADASRHPVLAAHLCGQPRPMPPSLDEPKELPDEPAW